MITDVRKYFKSTFAQIVLWSTILAMAGLFSLPQLLNEMKSGPWALKVNDQKVSVERYGRSVSYWQSWLTQIRAQYGEYADLLMQSAGFSPNPQKLAYEALVKQELLQEQVQTTGISVHPEHIIKQIKHPMKYGQEMIHFVPPYVINTQTGAIDERLLNEHFKRSGITMREFEQEVPKILARHTLVDIIGDALYVPSFDINQRLLADQGSKTFNVITLSFDTILKQEKKKEISEHELVEFYTKQNETSKKYFTPEKRSGSVWVFDPETYAITVSPEAIEIYYEKHKINRFINNPTQIQIRRILLTFDDKNKEDVRKHAQELRDQLIQNPDSFAQVAKKESADKKTASDGGLLPFFSKGELNETLERAAFMLEKDGQISDVLIGEDGFEIIQRVQKNMRTFKPLDIVRNEIEKTLRQEKFERVFQADMKQIITQEEAGRDEALKKLIIEKGSDPKELKQVTAQDGREAKQLFDIRTEGGLSFFVDNGKGYAVKLTNIIRATAPSLDSIKQIVTNDLYEKRAHDIIRERIKHAHAQIGTSSLDALAKEIGGVLTTTEELESAKSEKAKKLQEQGIPIARAFQLEKVGAVISLDQPRDGYIIILEKITPHPMVDSSGTKRIKKQLFQERKHAITEGFVASLYKHATIEVNEALSFNTIDK